MERQFIYIVQTKACVDQNDSTYKIGRTTLEPNTRMRGYPKNSEIIIFARVDNSVEVENRIIEIFDKYFIKRLDMGVEYYTGDIDDMYDIMWHEIHYSRTRKNATRKLGIIKTNLEDHNKKILLHRMQDSAILRNVSDNKMNQIISSVINIGSLENDVPRDDLHPQEDNIDVEPIILYESPEHYQEDNIDVEPIILYEPPEDYQEDNIDVEPIILYKPPEHPQEDNIETPIIHQNTLLSNVAHLQQEAHGLPQTTDNMSESVDCDDILMFVKYIKKNKPSWYTPGKWMHSSTLYGYFVETYPNIDINIVRFSTWAKGKLFSKRANKTINGKSGRSVLLYPYGKIP